MPYCDEKQVIFLHIPKTGGTAIKGIFRITQLDDPNPAITPSPQHLTSRQLRERLGYEKFEKFYKFTFVRNPWARMVSEYYWRQQLPKKREVLSFETFIRKAQITVENESYYEQEFGDHFIPQIHYTVGVNEVFRFEEFSEGIHTVAKRIGVKVGLIPSKPAKHYDQYHSHYDATTQAIVREMYRDEIEQYGYEFDADR